MAVEYTFQRLADWGVFDVILPFILIFAIVYAVLHKTKILGEKSKNFNVVIALVMGLSVVVPHVLYGSRCGYAQGGSCPRLANGLIDPVHVINTALPNVSIILIAVLMVLLIFGVWGSKVKLGQNSLSGIIALFAFLSVIFVFGSAAGWWYMPNWLRWLDDPNTQALVITILVFAIVIWWITKGDKEDEEKREDAFGKFFGSILDKDRES